MNKILKYCLILFSIFLAQNLCAQKITLSEKDASIEKIFEKIRKQTGYDFIYNSRMIKGANKITINVINADLETVLGICFADQPFTYVITEKTIVVKEKPAKERAVGEPIDVKGKVINENNQPVVSATVQVKSSSIKTVTDDNGFFNLSNIDENATLVITSVNIDHPYEIRAGSILFSHGDGIINVNTKITVGDTVVVEANTGYQKLKPNETTGSYVVIDKKKLDEQFSTNILKKLDGVTNGLLFYGTGKKNANGGDNTFSVRGLSTINASTQPLIVLDDNIYTGLIENINPNDVESVTILKDAAATSIYGVGGANGVIVITTKKGQLNKKFSIEANSTVNISQRVDLYSKQTMSTSDYIDVEQLLFSNGFFDNSIAIKYASLSAGVNIMLNRRNGKISATDSAAQVNALRGIDIRDDYNRYFNSPAVTQQYALSLSGGSKNIGWLLSGAYDKSTSSQDAVSQKLNLSLSNIFKVSEKVSVTIGTYYTNSNSVTGKPSLANLQIRNSPYQQFVDENGRPLAVGSTYNTNYTDTAGNGKLLDWNYYPFTDYLHDKSTAKAEQLLASINVNYKLSKAIQVSASYNYQKQRIENQRYSDIESFYTRDLINTFTNLNAISLDEKYPVPIGGIIRLQNYGIRSQGFRVQTNFKKGWKKHSINGIMGSEIRETVSDPFVENSIYGYRENPTISLAVDYRRIFKHYVKGQEIMIPDRPNISSGRVDRFVSLYGNLAYSFEGRYSLFGSFRKDASNLFGVNANDKWNPLWSAGMGWDISKESFYHFRSVFSDLKLKFTYGYSGNLDNSKTALPILRYTANLDLNATSATIVQPNNPSLKWEKSRQYNLGLTFSTANKKITGSLEYYQKIGRDLYGNTFYDYTTFGLTSTVTANIANLKTTGIDLAAQVKLISRKDFVWSAGIIFNYNREITTKYDTPTAADGSDLINGGNNGGNYIKPVIGKPLYALVAYRWAGLDANGNPQGYLNGHPSTEYLKMLGSASIYREQLIYMGPASPTKYGAISNNINWKGRLNISFNIIYRLGYYFLRPSFQARDLVNYGIGIDYEKRWQKPGDELNTTVPSFTYPFPTGVDVGARDLFYKYSEINVRRGDNIRLQYIYISYSIPMKAKNGADKTISVYANIANLGFIWKANKENIDPDNPTGYKIPKSFTIGLRANL